VYRYCTPKIRLLAVLFVCTVVPRYYSNNGKVGVAAFGSRLRRLAGIADFQVDCCQGTPS
jgi:hypothetical protein